MQITITLWKNLGGGMNEQFRNEVYLLIRTSSKLCFTPHISQIGYKCNARKQNFLKQYGVKERGRKKLISALSTGDCKFLCIHEL